MKYYIAYGSNLSVTQMAHRCPDAKIVGRAILEDWRLVFKLHATIRPEIGYRVPVLVWAISDRDEANLDRYEGYPRYYVKREIPVKVTQRNGYTKEIKAMVYIMNLDRGNVPPTPEYYGTILEGYRRFKFDESILRTACLDAYLAADSVQ